MHIEQRNVLLFGAKNNNSLFIKETVLHKQTSILIGNIFTLKVLMQQSSLEYLEIKFGNFTASF